MPGQQTATSPPAPPAKELTLRDFVDEMAAKYKVDPALAFAILNKESRGVHQDEAGTLVTGAPTRYGQAQGMFQVLPQTAAGYKRDDGTPYDLADPFDNIEVGIRNIREAQDRDPDPASIFAYYHGGSDKAKHGKVTAEYAREALADFHQMLEARQRSEHFNKPAGRTTRPGDIKVPTAEEVRAKTQAVGAGGKANVGGSSSAWDAAKAFGSEAVSSVVKGGKAINAGIQQAFWHPVDTAVAANQAVANATARTINDPIGTAKAAADHLFGPAIARTKKAYAEGDPLRTALEAKNVPLDALGLGTRLSEAEDFMRKGDVARGLGATADVALGVAGPELLQAGRNIRVAPALVRSYLDPVKQRAVEALQARGIPVDLGTATGNRWAKLIQGGAESTPLGAAVRGGVQLRRQQRLTQVGHDLADNVHPLAVAPQEAGRRTRASLQFSREAQHDLATTGYDELRAIEADPRSTRTITTGHQQVPSGLLDAQGNPIMHTVPITETHQLPVDMRPVKQALRPTYDDTLRMSTVEEIERSRGLLALRNIVEGPDFLPASHADRLLGAVKGNARVTGDQMRNVSQGLAAHSIDDLSTAIDTALAGSHDPRGAAAALQRGRAATVRKYQIQDVIDQLSNEDVGVFSQATAATGTVGDTHVGFLRELAQEAPHELPVIGRAYLENLLEKATQEGGFNRAAYLAREWQKLGPETRQLLYGPQHAADLDNFFLGAKLLAEHPNPSGSFFGVTALGSILGGFTGNLPGTIGGLLAGGGGAALLNSRRGVQLLTQGLTVPARGPAAAAWAAEVAGLLKQHAAQGPPPAPPTEQK